MYCDVCETEHYGACPWDIVKQERALNARSWRGEDGQPGSCRFCGRHRSLHREFGIPQLDCAEAKVVGLEDMLQKIVRPKRHIPLGQRWAGVVPKAAWTELRELLGGE